LCFVPLPFYTLANGLVWPSEQAQVRAGSEGFIQRVVVRDGERVRAGQPLIVLHDPVLFAQRESLGSRIEQLQHQRFSAVLVSPDQVRSADEEIARTESELQRVQQKIDDLNVRARVSGTLVLPHEQDLLGSFVRQGSTLGYVLDANRFTVRAVIPEYDVALVRSYARSVEVRVAGHHASIPATLMRDIPAATYELPSAVLGDRAGGSYATDPQDKDGLRTREPIIVLELTVPAHELQRVGARAWVRFDHDPQALASRWYRELRQVFLQHLNPAV
jgi:putative peptide zinc metalloprotease protein